MGGVVEARMKSKQGLSVEAAESKKDRLETCH